MAAERTPQTEQSSMARALVGIAHLAIRYPRATIAIAVFLAAVSIVFSAARMKYYTSRAALISQGSEFHQRWLEYTQEFGDQEDVVIVVEGPDRGAIVPALEEIASEVAREDRLFHSVFHDQIDLSRIRGKALYYLPLETLHAIDSSLDELGPILEGDWSALSPTAMAGATTAALGAISAGAPALGAPPPAHAMAALQSRLGMMCELLAAALDPSGHSRSPWPDLFSSGAFPSDLESQGLRSANPRFGFVLLKLADESSGNFARHADAIARLRQLVAAARTRYPHLRIGLTGLPVIEHDEMQSSQSTMTVTTGLELAGVVLVLVAGFGGLRHSLLAMSTLLLGMIWSFGYIALAVGHLNILSMAFGAILIGLGNNYGIYTVASYLQLRGDRQGVDASLEGTARTVAPGITLGAVSTAIAFFMAAFTEFPGVAELGLVAGGGILLCWLAAVTALPAMVHLSDARRPDRVLPTPLDFHRWLDPLVARPRLVLAGSLCATLVLGLGLARLKYDYNLLNMQPAGQESVQWEQRLLEQTGESAYFALSLADTPEEALERKARFLELEGVVERVDEVASLMPSELGQKWPLIQRIGQRLKDLPAQPPQISVPPQTQLAALLTQVRTVLAGNPQSAALARQLGQLGEAVGRVPPEDYYARLSGYLQRAAGDLLNHLHLLREVAHPQPPQWSDLPQGLVDRFVGRSGKLLLRVYGKGSLWDRDAMRQFVTQVRKVDAQATGNPFQVYEASRLMKRSYEQAALYALFIIVPVVFLDFGVLRHTFLAVLPLALAMVQLFGLMGLLDMPLNPANMIALPLMLGMGVDNGVHIMHDFRTQRGRYRMSHSTAVAVVLDTVTTMVGFALLMTAAHRGLQSLGRVLTLGMACCLLSSMVILPAILVLLTRHRAGSPEDEEASEAGQTAAVPAAPKVVRRDAAHSAGPMGRPPADAPRKAAARREPLHKG